MQQTPEFTIREDQRTNINFGDIQATDADAPGMNSTIYFYVTSEKPMYYRSVMRKDPWAVHWGGGGGEIPIAIYWVAKLSFGWTIHSGALS